MIQELAVFEAWRDRENLKIFLSLSPKIRCTLEKAVDQAMPDVEAVYLAIANGKKSHLSGWSKVYARKLSRLEKLWSRLWQ